MLDYIYTHLDTMSNAVIARGLHSVDFSHAIAHYPQNILLLDPSQEGGEYDMHTGLRYYHGRESVATYFQQVRRRRPEDELKWIDFNDVGMLKELSALEISELLYLGHMKTHLHSPFFYKLQNNFVFFEYQEDVTKIYYRYLDEFYRMFGNKITRTVLEKLNDRKTFFKRSTPVEKIDINLLQELRPILQNGVVFCFAQQEVVNREYTIPIYIVEDSLWKIKDSHYQNEDVIGRLIYNTLTRQWRLEKDDFLY
ncbi:MAG: hypothetical protein LBM95_04995 [Lactobacillales bacterium]|jgi:hypothetical protein|nr:hypothetical protein [Lactobacillales bacterium]